MGLNCSTSHRLGANKYRHINITDRHVDMQIHGKVPTCEWVYSHLPWLLVSAENMCLIRDSNKLNALSSDGGIKFELSNGGAKVWEITEWNYSVYKIPFILKPNYKMLCLPGGKYLMPF